MISILGSKIQVLFLTDNWFGYQQRCITTCLIRLRCVLLSVFFDEKVSKYGSKTLLDCKNRAYVGRVSKHFWLYYILTNNLILVSKPNFLPFSF